MNDRIAFSTEHFTVHRLDDPERPYRIDNGAGATRLGEPACVTIRMEYGKARIAWTGIGARDAGDARLFAGLVREACDVADRIIFMEGGVIVEEGDARSLVNDPKHERTKAFLSRCTEE